MKIDIAQIKDGEESVTVRYISRTPVINSIIRILEDENGKIWGRTDERSVCVNINDILYLESVDDKVFAYTGEHVLRIEGSLYSFINSVNDDVFFRCSKSMIINVNRVVSLKSLSSNRIDATMEGGEHIVISRRYASEFRKFLKGDR
ncbi:MAG: LytTR family transcriptional regulator DNA-binding domain-containing protein [Lachnospiraceae bacterium]|nr:LytTR family transcriptional regulator DNA-binding domain-containing protein [Lachnospiraceae bacterium]